MSMKSTTNPYENLFTLIEQHHHGAPVIFHFKKELEQEARGIIPALPLIMKKKLGDATKEWFTHNAFSCLDEFNIDSDENILTTNTNNIFSNLLGQWEPGTDINRRDKKSLSQDNVIRFGEFDLQSYAKTNKVKTSISQTVVPIAQHPEFDDQSTVADDRSLMSNSTHNTKEDNQLLKSPLPSATIPSTITHTPKQRNKQNSLPPKINPNDMDAMDISSDDDDNTNYDLSSVSTLNSDWENKNDNESDEVIDLSDSDSDTQPQTKIRRKDHENSTYNRGLLQEVITISETTTQDNDVHMEDNPPTISPSQTGKDPPFKRVPDGPTVGEAS
jgi:hypothetical protein